MTTFTHVRMHLDEPVVTDVRAATAGALAGCGVAIAPGMQVAVAIGSRGIGDLGAVVEAVVAWVRSQGAMAFLVPAMGSHGGATAEGQQWVVETFGVAQRLGLEIRSSMDTIELDRGACPVPVFTDVHAAAADAVVLVNRVKPHTDFHGPFESGLVKMAAIGLGKRRQAELLHAHGVRGLRDLMPQVGARVLAHSNVVLGVAIVENALDQTMHVEALPASSIVEREPALLDVARAHMPRLMVDELDVLLVDRMGKDISGVGMDTNVIGRMMVTGLDDPATPLVRMIGCHRLSEASHGNACGMGLADVVPQALMDAVDMEATQVNVITSGALLRGKTPLVASTDRDVWELCCRGASVVDVSTVRAMRIVDTLHCADAWVSDVVLAELGGDERVEIVARDRVLHDEHGTLMPFA
jgi:hypothetical protein